ncbi:MAG: Dabb family protein [Prevotellaceae bacterium]|jgi:hypothetical protein|nr:Dabb family protein [Prevotellaceae bacterium]
MIKHIVFFELAEHAEGRTKAENALKIKHDLENLIHLIPELKTIEVGINHADAPATNYDAALYVEVESLAALDIYQKHPEHQKVTAFISKIKTARAAVDYEV